LISASAAEEPGTGGSIRIVTPAFFASPDSNVDASAPGGPEFQGTVEISSPESDVLASVTPLETDFLDAAAQLQPACAARARGAATGSFTVARQRGLASAPEDLLLAFDEEGLAAAGAVPAVAAPPRGAPAAGGAGQAAMASLARGAGAFRGGHFQEARAQLSQASQLYAELGDSEARLDALRALAQAQQAEGRFAESLETLAEALSAAERVGDMGREAALRGSLGNAYLALGNWEAAEQQLRRGVELAREAQDPALAAGLLNNLANLYAARGEAERALEDYAQSAHLAAEASRPVERAKALSNAARAASEAGEPGHAAELLDEATEVAETLEPTHEKASVWIHLAATWRRLDRPGSLLAAHAALTQAILLARELDDPRTLSYALGNLGGLYAEENRNDEALLLMRRALGAAEQADAPELLYRWHWQEGRLLWAQGKSNEALRSYRRAVALLQEIRPESRAQYGSAQARFRRAVAPVYVDFVDSLVQGSGLVSDPADAQRLLVEARATMEQLKAAELRDYFRDECVAEIEAHRVDLDRVSRESRAALVYPIALPERLELLVSLPSGIERVTVPVGAEELRRTVQSYGRGLQSRITTHYRESAQQLYDWLVRPYAARLAEEKVGTLVFVPDAALRAVPMAALHDGEQFLVERYAVAVTPGLSLVDPRPLDAEGARLLLAGLSEPVQGFAALPNTTREIEAIRALYGGEVLLDEAFETARFEAEVETEVPSVVHVASHAVFTGDPATSFVLTHDDRLTMDELSEVVAPTQFRRRPLELLTLSACETAAGDERAALGLAGVAIRAGARSALGSLWAVQDEATYELVVAFYAALKEPGVSKAEALRRAQAKLIADPRFSHPFYWSAFLLISNWL
jgi:CHAT domain-containing protein